MWCNGSYFEGALSISPSDRGLCHGLGLFETLLAVNGRLVAPDLHFARMVRGAERLGWTIQTEEFGAAATALLGRNGLLEGRARVRIACTAGSGGLADLRQGDDRRVWITAVLCPVPPTSLALVTSPFPRNELSPLAGLKCASYAENLIALDHARRAGADEPLFFNTRGHLCETATANVFLVKDGEIFTPSLGSGCLPGTLRERVIGRFPVTEEALTAGDVGSADEIFVTSATRGVVPVARIDGRSIARSTISMTVAEAVSRLT